MVGVVFWVFMATVFVYDISQHTPGQPYVDHATPLIKKAAEKLHLTGGEND